ncbi:MAG TPA: S9 family peptidase [Actinomycetota bacterium]|nr:S9 family peptidase [Actinomycetota bacterium]
MAGMVPQDVYALTGVADPRISPDERWVAYGVWSVDAERNEYRGAIWVTPVDGSSPPRRVTAGTKRDANPRWSPDGARLAFTSNRDTKAAQLYLLPMDGGDARRLTDLPEDVADPRWSPDGTRLLFASRVRDEPYAEEDDARRRPRRFRRLRYRHDNIGWIGDRRQHLFVVPADGSGKPRQITDGDFDDADGFWSPDGSTIAFSSSRDEDWDLDPVSDIYVVDAEGGDPTKLTHGDGSCDGPAWSPDGSRIAYRFVPGLYDIPRHSQIAVIPSSGGPRTVLTAALDRTCNLYPPGREPIWRGDRIVFAVEDRGNAHLYQVLADGSAPPSPLMDGETVVTGWDAVGETVVYSAGRPTALDELFVADRPRTSVGDAFAHGRELVEPEPFTAVSWDGTEVDAWIVRPAGFVEGTRYPVLLSIHGGPFTRYGNRLFDEFQVYAGAGYAVVYSNPRGSSGYTEAWGRAIRGPVDGGPGWGTLDYQDVMAAIDTALQRFDFCDPDRVGVLGGSYGGFMTSWIVSHTDRFRAACSERAVNQWVSFYGASDIGPWFPKGYMGGFLFEDFDAWVAYSPATYAQNIRTPLLILHSEDDLRCPIDQGEQLFTTLRLLKREVEFVRFPKESHELSRSGNPVHRVMRFEVILDWFDRHLKP